MCGAGLWGAALPQELRHQGGPPGWTKPLLFLHPQSHHCRQLILQLLSQGAECSSSDCGLGVRLPGLKPQLQCVAAAGPGASDFTPLSLSFPPL